MIPHVLGADKSSDIHSSGVVVVIFAFNDPHVAFNATQLFEMQFVMMKNYLPDMISIVVLRGP